jgi:hypothetical protein
MHLWLNFVGDPLLDLKQQQFEIDYVGLSDEIDFQMSENQTGEN